MVLVSAEAVEPETRDQSATLSSGGWDASRSDSKRRTGTGTLSYTFMKRMVGRFLAIRSFDAESKATRL